MADFVERTGKTVEEAIEAALFALRLPEEHCTVEILEEPSNGFFGLIGKRAAKVRVTAKEETPSLKKEFFPIEDDGMDATESYSAHAEEEPSEKDLEKETVFTQHPMPERSMSAASREDSSKGTSGIIDRGFSYAPSREDRSFSELRHERFSSGRRSYASESSYSRVEKNRTSENPIDAEASLKKAEDFLQQIFGVMELDVSMERRERPHSFELNLSGHNLGILIGKHGQTLDALQYLVNLAANQGATEDRVRIILDIENYRERREETLCRLATRLAERCCRTNQRVVLEPMNRHERKIIHLALQENHRVLTYSAGDEPFRKVVIEPKHRVSRMDGSMREEDY